MEPNTQYIEISNLTFYGYFPQSYNAINNIAQIGKQRIFNYGDKNIINLIHQKVSMNEIKSILNDENFYSKNFLDTFFEEQLIIFYEQESSADIKMYDYLATNYNKNILFHAYNRPHKSLIKKLAQRLLRYLDFNDLTFKNEHLIDKENDLYYQSQAIYPSVLKYLNLSTKDTYYPNRYILDDDFNFNEYIETYINCYSTYSKVPITNKIRPTISIWGSCVSREIFNYTDRYKINIYILQNPIHTLNFKGLPLNPDIIQGSSNFTKKMCYLEFNKLAEKFFAKEKSDFLMIDTCDCRNFFYTLANDSTARISSSISSDMTIKKLIAENLYEEKFFKRISPFEISDSEWKQHVKYFCDTILRYYDKDRIILNKFNFAEYYLDKGRYIKFENFLFYKKLNILTKKIEFFIKDYLNDCILLKEVKSPVANKNHHIGCAPMHYTDDVYLHQVNQLDNIIS